MHVTIFHTNDMHARLEAMARLSAFARRSRDEAERDGDTVFFWDAGDAADRRVEICRATKGAGFGRVLNAMGYSLQTMGNDLALPYGPQVMREVAANAKFPILAANFRDEQDELAAGLQETAMFALPAGGKLGVFGLTSPFDGLYDIFGMRFPDAAETARQCIEQLRAQGATVMVMLSHLGLQADRELTERVSGIDVIIGAHSHDCLPEGEMHAGVLIAQAGQYAEGLGRVDLTLDAEGRVIKRAARVIEVPVDESPDPAVLEAIAQAERQVVELMAEPIGASDAELELDYFQECRMGNMTADALRERMKAEVALVAGGHFHTGLPQGTITRGALSASCFSTANPAVTRMRGAELEAALERGLDPEVSRRIDHGFRGNPEGIPQISGMTIEFEAEAENGARVRGVLVNGVPLVAEQMYRVAHTDAESFADLGYFDGKDFDVQFEVPIILGEVLADYFAEHSPLPPVTLGRWQKVS